MTAKSRLVGALVCLIGILGAYQLSYSPDQFSFKREREFYRVITKDFIPDGPPGYPELPVCCLTYILPPGVKADSVSIKACKYKLIGDYYLYPVQPQEPSDSTPPWVPPDSAIYNSKSPYPAAPIGIQERGYFDGASVVTIAVHPLMYIPVLREVYLVSSVEFDFFVSKADPPSQARIRGINAQKTYDLALRAIIENGYEIPVYYHPPMLIPEQLPAAQGRQSAPAPREYTIITNDLLADSFQPFADWLTDKGVPACVVRLSDVLPCFSGVDDAEKLRNYLRFGYEQCGTVWVLLGGDAGVVPFRYGWSYDAPPPRSDSLGDMCPSDLYFSDMNGNWDCDSDGRLGEPTDDSVDVYPELFVGRLTVREPDKVHNWVRKMLFYEKSGSNDLSQFHKATWIYDPAAPGGNPFVPPNDVKAAFPGTFDHTYYCQSTAPVARDAFGRTNGVIVPVPASGIYNINAHGSPQFFCPESQHWSQVWADSSSQGEGQYDAGLRFCDLAGDHYVVYSTSCYTAAFDSFITHSTGGSTYNPSDTIIADAFTDFYPTTLGIAYLGNTRYGRDPSLHLQKAFWQLFFGGGIGSPYAATPSLGVAEGLSKVVYSIWLAHHVRHCHNLFGSPELEPWIMWPGSMFVQAPSTIHLGAPPVLFAVHVRDAGGVGISGVRVCLHKTDDIYLIDTTDAQGLATFAVQPESLGTILVTCTRSRGPVTPGQQYLPAQATCAVVLADGPQAGENGLPKELGFTSSTPNPALGDFTVQYGVPVKGRVRLTLCDIQGRVESVIRDGELNPGYHRDVLRKDGRSVPAGVHFLVLAQNGKRLTRKLVLME